MRYSMRTRNARLHWDQNSFRVAFPRQFRHQLAQQWIVAISRSISTGIVEKKTR
jgi:hypothetical protein